MYADFGSGNRFLQLGGVQYLVTLSTARADIPLTGVPLVIDANVSFAPPPRAEAPEPGALVLAAFGAAGFLARGRRSRT